MRTDYELMISAKAKNSRDVSELYHRYIPLIYKHARSVKMRDSDQKSDYAQDAFLRYLKAVEYVDIEKIRDIKTWKFYQVFDWFLQNLDKKYRKVLYHIGAELSYSHDEDIEDDSKGFTLHASLGHIDHSITECERVISKRDFLKKLTPFQKNILNMRRNNKTIATIAKELGVSYGTIHGHIYKARKLAETIIL